MLYVKQFIYAFLCTVGFSVFFNIPKDAVIKSGLSGALAWLIYINSIRLFSSAVAGAFFAAITVGILGEFMAKRFKKPATIFIIPGIVPLVPGAGMYYTMLAIIEKDFMKAADTGTEAIFVAAAIAVGIIVASSLSRVLARRSVKKTI